MTAEKALSLLRELYEAASNTSDEITVGRNDAYISNTRDAWEPSAELRAVLCRIGENTGASGLSERRAIDVLIDAITNRIRAA